MFQSMEDFFRRMDGGELNKRAVENFIKCGAMDCFGYHRSELLGVYDSMMDSVAASRKKNLEGQMGLFAMLEGEDEAVSVKIPPLKELPKADLMAMEKETTGIYLTGHPMDDYRQYLKGTHVVPIGDLMSEEGKYRDEQIVSVAGIIQEFKMKTTRNNSVMAYLTVEDDTAAMEMLAFSNVLNQYGGYLKENSPVVITGRLSLRDDKDPQIVVNRARLITDFAQQQAEDLYEGTREGPLGESPTGRMEKQQAFRTLQGTLYLRLPGEAGKLFPKVRAMLNMFPGESKTVLYFEDTKVRRGTHCALREDLLQELTNVLGKANVVLK